MATVTLGRWECAGGRLPMVCVITGLPAESELEKRFTWRPEWVNVLFVLICLGLLGILALLIVSMAVSKKMTVHLPVAEGYRNYWLWRKLALLVGVTFSLGVLFTGIVMAAPGGNKDLGLYVTLSGVGMFILVLCVGVFLQRRTVRPIEITESRIRLTCVHPDFKAALLEMREKNYDSDEEDEPNQRRRRRDDDDADMDDDRDRRDRLGRRGSRFDNEQARKALDQYRGEQKPDPDA